MPRLSEDELIARFFVPLAGPAGLGLADDAALLMPPAGHELVLTADMLMAGVHFFADDPAEAIAKKALRVNLSDLAAKGAEPVGFLLNLALPGDWSEAWLAAFAAGLGEDAKTYGCPLIGGDTVKSAGALTLSITAIGAVPQGAMVPRSGVAEGDLLYVTGTIGDAALGLRLCRAEATGSHVDGGFGCAGARAFAFALSPAAAAPRTQSCRAEPCSCRHGYFRRAGRRSGQNAAAHVDDGRDRPRRCAAFGCGTAGSGARAGADRADPVRRR